MLTPHARLVLQRGWIVGRKQLLDVGSECFVEARALFEQRDAAVVSGEERAVKGFAMSWGLSGFRGKASSTTNE